eukprot:150132_1
MAQEKFHTSVTVMIKFHQSKSLASFNQQPNYALFVASTDTISYVKTRIQDQHGIPTEKQRLIFAGKDLLDEQTLSQVQINEDGCTIHCLFKEKSDITKKSIDIKCVQCFKENAKRYAENEAYIDSFKYESKFQIFVKTMTGRTWTLDVAHHFTIKQTKALLVHKTAVGKDKLWAESMRFIFTGKQLEDNRCLKDYKVQKESTMHLVLRLWGGGIAAMHYDAQSGDIVIGREYIDSIIKISSFHVSCKSDRIKGQNMAGIVLYAYDNKQEWSINNVGCKSGYIVLKSAEKIKHIQSKYGQVHGKCYKSV